MKIQFNPKDFLRKFRLAATVVGKEHYGRHITSVKIVADKRRGITLIATNLDMTIRVKVDGMVDTGGTSLLPVKRLVTLLQLCKDESATLASTGDGVVLRYGTKSTALDTADPKEFPDVAEFPKTDYCEITAFALQAAINRTAFATDKERYSFGACTGVCFESDGKHLDVVATDGQSMAWQRIDGIDRWIEPSVVPSATLALLEKVLRDKSVVDKDDDVKMAFGSKSVSFRCGDVTIFSRPVEGRFPAWKAIVPDKRKMPLAKVACGELQYAIRIAMIGADKARPRVLLSLDAGQLTVESHFTETIYGLRESDDYRDEKYNARETFESSGSAQHSVSVSYTGEPVSFCLDPKRLTAFLSAFKDDTVLSLYLPTDADKPILIVPEDGYTYLIKPQNESARVQSDADDADEDEVDDVEEPDADTGVEVAGQDLPVEEPMREPVKKPRSDSDSETRILQLLSENEQLEAKAEHYKALLARAMRVIEKMKEKDRCVAFS